MRARMQSLEMLANNLANAETGGFKADREFYSIYTGEEATASPVTGVASTLPVIESQWTDHSQGNLRVTSNPLDFAIDGDGFFAVQTAAGTRYTRNGSFRVSPSGQIATTDGNPVLGAGGKPIQLRPGLPVEMDPDGTLRQGGVPAGRLELAAFAKDAVVKTGLNYFAPAEGAQPVAAKGTILQGKVEQSNVGAAESSVRLVAIMRQFEMLQKAMNIGNELNRRAMEEVAHI